MTADSPLDFLFGLEQHGIKLGLDNIRTLCDALGHPERSFSSIVIAGTNGKGSVAAMVDTALSAAGLTSARFTSPHLVDLEERFVVNGRPVSRPVLSDLAGELRDTVRDLQAAGRLEAPPTFFEATTAIAFLLFRASRAHVAVLEVGMGGRFDATNVVSPAAVAITTIDLDHEHYLGRSVSAIAFEKAGVIKPGGLVVTGETKSTALGLLRRVARERDARLIEALEDVAATTEMQDGASVVTLRSPHATYGPVTLALRGRHQVHNAIVAARVLEEVKLDRPIPGQAVEAGLTQAVWPGRLDLIPMGDGRAVLLDAAHNVAAAGALGRYLGEVYPGGVPLVLAVMRDKDVRGMLSALGPYITGVVCTTVQHLRALTANELSHIAAATCPHLPCTVADTPRQALDTAWSTNDVICAAGSLYLVGELLHHRPQDPSRAGTRAQIPG